MPKLVNTDKVAEAIAWLNEYDFVLWHDVMECINKVPEVDAEPIRHGHWILQANGHGMCSTCGIFVNLLNGMTWEYCPNCGAKMDEEREDA